MQLIIQIKMEESIYNIIPKQYNPPKKGPIHKSKYPKNIPPTGSTFNNLTTSKPGVSNLGGQMAVGLQAHTELGQTKTLGHLKGDRRPQPQNFLKKNTGTMGNETLPQVHKFQYNCAHKREPVPCVKQKPVMNLQSNKNFIVTNAIENILSVSKKMPVEEDWTKKKDYGKTPEYLQKVKENILNQYKMVQNINAEQNVEKKCLADEEIYQIREGLKRKWDQINKEYQKITHVRVIDTIGLKAKKETYERELKEIETDIKKLNKLYIFVE